MEETLRDREAVFERMITEHGARIRAGVYSLIHNREDAEDIIAEINLALWISLPKFNGRSSLRTFIYAVSLHKIKDYLRRKYREPDILRIAMDRTGEEAKNAISELEIKVRFLTRAEIVILGFIARGFSNERIARTLFKSINTVRTHIKHINSKLGTINRVESAFIFNRCAEKQREGEGNGKEKNLL
jgi:RNA polymerase sigma-70 factor (ECF subfamily)